MSKTYISVQNLLTDYLHSKLYNIPIKQIRYQAKWLSGHITDLDVRSICDYQTPFEQASNMKNEIFPEGYSPALSIRETEVAI